MDKALLREIHQAQNIQLKLLNAKRPALSKDEVSGISVPARMIGGDYFDFYSLPNGKIRIIIGDVMGKGIPAAMLMILTRGAFRSAAEATKSPGDTITAMNNAIYQDLRELKSFVTVFCADWDPATGQLVYANAGHLLPIVIRPGSQALHVPEVKGVMLGGLPHQNYKEESISLQAGDLVFFYTDGIVEAQNERGEMYKLDRLVRVLSEHAHHSVEKIEYAVIENIKRFTHEKPQKDDITMVILKVGGTS